MYKCKYCGKEFEKNTSLGAHVSMCKLNPNFIDNFQKRKEHRKQVLINKNQQIEQTRKDRILICKHCGKEYKLSLTDKEFEQNKYSNFCSRSCANSRCHSKETKEKIGQSLKLYQNNEHLENHYKTIFIKKEDIPLDICNCCGKPFLPKYIYNEKYYKILRHLKYCSEECLNKFRSDNRILINKKYNLGGFKEGSVRNYKSGWYKGIHCDSSWELAFVIYHIDHNIKIERCKEIRKYILDNKELEYHPDFIIENKIYEIKGIKSKNSDAKQLYNQDIIFLFKKDMKKYLDYVINKYGNDFIELYEQKDK